MCWNRTVSLVAAALAWCACARLATRGGRLDRWFATYLFTYTLTQLVDAAFWTLDARNGGLDACPGRRMTFAEHGPPGQRANFVLSKYVIPAVVLVQYAAQLSYPSAKNRGLRRVLLLGYAAAALVMAYTSGCTDVVRARFPVAHDTLRWGGYSSPALPILLVAAATIGNFVAVVDDARVLAVLVAPFLVVITFLWSTEGTLALGSKWCTYCLVYAALFLAAPYWDPHWRSGPPGNPTSPCGPSPKAGSQAKPWRTFSEEFPDLESDATREEPLDF